MANIAAIKRALKKAKPQAQEPDADDAQPMPMRGPMPMPQGQPMPMQRPGNSGY